MRTPTIHLNGSSRTALFEAYSEASSAVRRAISATEAAAPHARDYYVQSDRAYDEAVDEHRARVTRLADVRNELYAILESIMATT